MSYDAIPHAIWQLWIETATTVYREELHRPIDPSGLASCLEMALRGETVETMRQWVRASDEYAAVHTPGLSRLHIQGTSFHEPDGRLWKWHGQTAFRLYQRWLEGTIEQAYVLPEVNLVRVLGMWDWTDRPFAPARYGASYYDALPMFARWLGVRGVRLEFTVFADAQQVMVDEPPQRHHLARVAEALRDEPNVFLEVCNEPFKNGVVPSRLGRPSTSVLCASGDYDVEMSSGRLYALDYVTVHTPRDREWMRKAKDVLELTRLGWDAKPSAQWAEFKPLQIPGVADEPIGIGTTPGSRTLDAQALGEYFAVAELFGAGATIHGDFGFEPRPPTDGEQRCIEAIARAWEAVPADAQLGSYTAGHLADCPVAEDGALRVYGMIQGSRAAVVRVQPQTPSARTRNGWRVVSEQGPVVLLAR